MIGRIRALAFATVATLPLAMPVAAKDVSVSSNVITQFKSGSSQTQFGPMEFIGGLEMASEGGALGGWSALRMRSDGKRFIGVQDTGEWIEGALVRDADGRLTNLEDVSISPILDKRGKPGASKWRVDSESVVLRANEILVGFERNSRIDVYPDPGFASSKPLKSLNLLIPQREIRQNKGPETLVAAPADGPLGGAVLTIMEGSINKQGDLFAAVIEGPRKGIFFVKKDDPYEVTDGAFLPNGDLLILERRFGFTTGIGMQLRQIKADDIKPGATVDGPVILEADSGYQIDNMEGLDVFKAEDGSTHLIIVSDDNYSLLQRNLMLEFRLSQ